MTASSAIPGFIAPQLATLAAALPDGKGWLQELKFDGYRMIALIRDGKATLVSRNGKEWTAAFQPIADMLGNIAARSAVLDGEVVVTDAAGRTNFSDLKTALSTGKSDRFQYYAFDLLRLGEEDLRPRPLTERKAVLKTLLERQGERARKHILYSESFDTDPAAFLKHVCGLGMEGVVCKQASAPYTSGRSKAWLKVKCGLRQEFVIGGFTQSTTGRSAVGALLLGYYDAGKLYYAGRVGTGWSHAEGEAMWRQLTALKAASSPFLSVDALGRKGALWTAPELVCEVSFAEWTPDDHLRHPSFQGLREDKQASEVRREVAVKPAGQGLDT